MGSAGRVVERQSGLLWEGTRRTIARRSEKAGATHQRCYNCKKNKSDFDSRKLLEIGNVGRP